MRILHLSTTDGGGGAARAAYRLHAGLRRLGQDSSMLVARKGSADPHVRGIAVPDDWLSRRRRQWRRNRIARDYDRYRPTLPPGIEPFADDRSEYAGLVAGQLGSPPPDLINLHWVAGFLDHGAFFAAAPAGVPVIWRLADMAPLTGGCHYDQHCGKFAARCGACPQLGSRDEHDLSRRVWARKRRSLATRAAGTLQIVGTSRWIAGEAGRSSLLGDFPVTVIPNGLDTDDFAPRDRAFARDLWGIPRDANVVLFLAESVVNVRKGFKQLAEALAGIERAGVARPFLLSVGGAKPQIGSDVPHLSLGKITNDRVLSTAYSAADVYVTPALQESFGQTVTESMACGTPVVAFASGGIVDMVRPGQTGWLAPTGDVQALRQAIVDALTDPNRAAMADTCRRVAVSEYSLDVQARAYLRLYESVLARAQEAAAVAPAGPVSRVTG